MMMMMMETRTATDQHSEKSILYSASLFETAFSTSCSDDELKDGGGNAATQKEVDHSEKSMIDSGSILETATTARSSADEVKLEGGTAATVKEVDRGSLFGTAFSTSGFADFETAFPTSGFADFETAFPTRGSADEVQVDGGDAATTKKVDAEKSIVDGGSTMLETATTTCSSPADEAEVEGGNAASKKEVDSGSTLETATTTRSLSADEVEAEGGGHATKMEVDSGSILETATTTSGSADEVKVERGNEATKQKVEAENSIIYSASLLEITGTTTSSSSADAVEVEGGNAETKKKVDFSSEKSTMDSGSTPETTATSISSSTGDEGGTAATKKEDKAPLAWLRRSCRWVTDAHEDLHTSSWLSCNAMADAFPSATTCGLGKAETSMRTREALKLAGKNTQLKDLLNMQLKDLLLWPVDFDELSFQDTDDEEWYFSGSYDRGSMLLEEDGEIDQQEFVKGIDGIYTALEEEGEIKPCIHKPNTPIPQFICYDEGTITKTESVVLDCIDKPPEPKYGTAQLLMYQKDFVLGNIRRMRTIAGIDNSKNHNAYLSKITTAAALHHSRTTDSAPLQAPPPHQHGSRHPPVVLRNYMQGNLETPCAEKIELQLIRDKKKKVVLEQQQKDLCTKKRPWWRHRNFRVTDLQRQKK